jgi:hypothetical protein
MEISVTLPTTKVRFRSKRNAAPLSNEPDTAVTGKADAFFATLKEHMIITGTMKQGRMCNGICFGKNHTIRFHDQSICHGAGGA